VNAGELSLRKHLEELRKRLLVSVVVTVITTAVAFVFYKQIIRLLLRPADLEAAADGGPGLVFIEVTEMVAVTMKVSLVSGLVLAFPIVLYQVIMFVAPGLTSREKRYLFAFMPAVVLAFVAGVSFGYFVLIPPAISFLVGWGSDIATPMIRIGNYVNVMVMLLFWMGVVFETPIVMFLLAKLGIVSWRGFARWRKYWVVVAFILGALITPTFDPMNQSLVAVPLIVLYELGIWLARLAARPGRSMFPKATPEGG
jgi:sec-independent protein translocase protein TatC